MCHDLDFDLLRQAQAEELARRAREGRQGVKETDAATPAKPAMPAPAVRDKEPLPA